MASDLLPVSGAILAGGQSRRMGRNKAFLEVDGRPVIRRLIERFDAVFSEVLIVSNDPGAYRGVCAKVVADIFPGRGPLAGIHSALSHAKNGWIFVSACDCVFFNPEVVRGLWALSDGVDAVVAELDGYLEPLNALYSAACLGPVRRRLEESRLRVVSFYPEIRLRVVSAAQIGRWDPTGRMFWNMNTPADYRAAVAALSELSPVLPSPEHVRGA